MFDSADYELRWPREVLARELAALRRTRPTTGRRAEPEDERIVFLLEDAFGEGPAEDYRQQAATGRRVPGAPWDEDPWGVNSDHRIAASSAPGEDSYLDALVAALPELREHHEPAPYWPDRQRVRRSATAPPDPASLRRRFARLVEEHRARGLFGRDLPPVCVDDSEPVNEADVLESRLGIPGLWPLQPETWDSDTFYGLVEVFHDLAVRPRERSFHSWDGCGWHYSVFSADTGRALYRWSTNRLLERGGATLRLADSGEDVGRLIQVTDEARGDLVDRVLAAPDHQVTDQVQHAISLFRRRDATTHDKRSAVVALANVLEDRRALLKSSLFSDDETQLFHIANKFDLRHRNDKQHAKYDPAFRDWVFWWYLATIELTDQLIERQPTRDAAATP